MTHDVHLSHSRTFPADVERAFDDVMPVDLSQLFDRRYLAVPPVRAVRDQGGPWGTVGQTRTIALADGGTMRETLTEVSRPTRFAYRISDVTGPMKPLIRSLDGAWDFEPAGTGVRITWSWILQPAGRLGSAAMPAFGRMWQGYARQGFENIERLVVR
jgi:hypothetical protein